MPLMGIREYGRHRGVSHVAVLKAIRTDRIRQRPDGLIDSEGADRDWDSNTHPAPRAPNVVPNSAGPAAGFAKARTVRAHYEALLAKLDFEQRSGELVSADEVKVAAFRLARTFKEHMLRIPDRVAAQVAAEGDERRAHMLLDSAIRAALSEFADSNAPTA